MTPPSYDIDEDEHCCDCEGCWDQDKECPYMVPQFCMLCNDKSTIGLLVDREIQSKLPMGKHAGGSALFWACDNHVNDEKLLTVLKKGVPFNIAHNRAKFSSFVRREIEKLV